MIDDFGVISASRTFKGYSEEHRMIKLNGFISLSEGKTISGIFSIDWTETFEGIKIPHRKQDCLDCDNGKICSDRVKKSIMNCFICEIERPGKLCLDLISQKKTYSTDINILKRKPPNEYHQMLPYYVGEYEPKQKKLILKLQEKFLWKKIIKWLLNDVLRGFIMWWRAKRTQNMKVFLKKKRNIWKQT